MISVHFVTSLLSLLLSEFPFFVVGVGVAISGQKWAFRPFWRKNNEFFLWFKSCNNCNNYSINSIKDNSSKCFRYVTEFLRGKKLSGSVTFCNIL